MGLTIASIRLALLPLVLVSACSSEPDAESRAASVSKFEDHLPLESKGRRATGTRDDPFIAIGVLKTLIPLPNEQLVRIDVAHRAVPHFKNAMDMGVYVPPEVVQGANEGDFVMLHYAKLIEGTRAEAEFRKAVAMGPEKATWRRPHVWFGYELYKITPIPDAVSWREQERIAHGSATGTAEAQKR